MSIFSRLFQRARGTQPDDAGRTAQAVERIAAAIPQLKLARQYQARLAPAVRTTLDYATQLVAALPEPRAASASAWSADPYIHAFFATADDVCDTFGRSHELRAWFDEHFDCSEAYAVLGMTLDERHVLGVEEQHGKIRSDVQQTTLSFGDHRVRICARSAAELHDEIVRRIVDQFALEALARIAEDKSRRAALEQQRALLKARAQLLQRQGAGIHAMASAQAPVELAELARLQRDIDANERSLAELGLQTEAIERQFDIVQRVFAEPGTQTYVTVNRVRLNRMNVVVEAGGAQAADELDLRMARIPAQPSDMRAFSIVRFQRCDLPPAGSRFDEASWLVL